MSRGDQRNTTRLALSRIQCGHGGTRSSNPGSALPPPHHALVCCIVWLLSAQRLDCDYHPVHGMWKIKKVCVSELNQLMSVEADSLAPVVKYVSTGELYLADEGQYVVHQPLCDMPNHFYISNSVGNMQFDVIDWRLRTLSLCVNHKDIE